jgi:16S rRNA (cytosine967-C5)-methyltransferase
MGRLHGIVAVLAILCYHCLVAEALAAPHSTRLKLQSCVTLFATSQESSPTTSSPRYLATKALTSRAGSFSVDRMEQDRDFANSDIRDRSFARLLLTTTERRLGQIDKVIAACLSKTKANINPFVKNVLRIGAAQILFLDTPSHAAVGETVEVLREHKKSLESQIKFVNAILRRMSREKDSLLALTDASDNVTPWLLKEWKESWGPEATERIVACAMQESPRCLTIKQPMGAGVFIQQFVEQLPAAQLLPQGSVQIIDPPAGPITSWPLYGEGSWWLQDPSATLPALVLYRALCNENDAPENMHVVDLCASPGGKTAQLCNFGFKVTAVEISERRSRRLKKNMARLNMDFELVIADGSEWVPTDPVSGVLVDAPCTATGTASKRPDVLRKDPSFEDLLDTQFRLACHAADEIIEVGGILIYATCSLLKQESEDQVAKLLARESSTQLETVPLQEDEVPGFGGAIDENGWLRILPGSPGLDQSLAQCDGFFVARLRRIR